MPAVLALQPETAELEANDLQRRDARQSLQALPYGLVTLGAVGDV